MSLIESIFYMMWRGMAIGVLISAPMGPVGILCIQRTLDKGRKAGFYTGIGAALSDLFYCVLTGFGLSFIEDTLERNSSIIQLVGSVVLIAFSIYLFRKNPTSQLKRPAEIDVSAKKNILGGFLFTFSNPLILFLIIGLFARFNFLMPEIKVGHYLVGYIFILLGALGWWWVVTFFIDKVRAHFNLRSMWLINRIIGVVILIFAVVGIVSAIMDMTGGSDSHARRISMNTPQNIVRADELGSSEPDNFCIKWKIELTKGKEWYWAFRDEMGEDVALFTFSLIDKDDGISVSPALRVDGKINGESILTGSATEFLSLNLSPKMNYIEILKDERGWQVSAGFYSLSPILILNDNRKVKFDSLEIGTPVGGEVKVYDLTFETEEKWIRNPKRDSDFDSLALKSYIDKSYDLMEGYWRVFDRSLEEDLMRLGGDYLLAIVKDTHGGGDYKILYLSGGNVNAGNWEPGDIKGELHSTGWDGIWNLVWYDSMGRPLKKDLKAQRIELNTLFLQFPYQNSTLRLQKLEKEN